MQNQKYNPLTVVYFIAAFGITYLLMPYVLEFFNLDTSKDIIQRLKNAQIFLEFLVFVGIFVAVAFIMEFTMKLFASFRKK